jgi:diguanylate cyclase (GGDEF)-like protein/PAS domain S-box-containing protein
METYCGSDFYQRYDDIATGVVYVSSEGKLVCVNKMFCRMLGYGDHSELEGSPVIDITHPDDVEESRRYIKKLFEGSTDYTSLEKRYVRKDGSVFWALTTGNAIRNAEGEIVGSLGFINDMTTIKKSQEAMERHAERYMQLFQKSFDGIFMMQEGRFIEANPRMFEILKCDVSRLIGATYFDISPTMQPDGKLSYERGEVILKKAYEGEAQQFVWEHLCGDGSRVNVEVSLSLMQLEETPTLLGTWRDISERIENEKQLRLFESIFDTTADSVVITDPEMNILSVNKAFSKISGYTTEEAVGEKPKLLSSGLHDQNFYKQMWESINSTGSWSGEIWDRDKEGELYGGKLTINSLKDASGTVVNYIGIFTDVTEKKQAEDKVYRLAYFDVLTGLPNRTLFLDRLRQILNAPVQGKSMTALLVLDMDNFNRINDTLGHAFGDRLLQTLAQRIESLLRESDTLCRIGGDEFSVILPDIKFLTNAGRVAEKVLESISRPVLLEGQEVTLTGSIGIAVSTDVRQAEEFIKHADTAVFQAKHEGRNTYAYFDPKMNERIRKNLELENGLRRAIEKGEFRLHYQPQVNANESRMIGVEALLRWNSERLGTVSPAEFIPVAEESGLIVPIGRWVVEEAMLRAMRWKSEGLHIPVAVNLSAVQFRDNTFVDTMARLVRLTGCPPSLVELELTESILMENSENVLKMLLELKEIGFRISIDDFGTGFSSMSYLSRFPLDKLKVDYSFVQGIGSDRGKETIVKSIIGLSKNLGLMVIAEGVETKAQLEFLLREGCDQIQGFYFSQPVPEDEIAKFCKGIFK